MSAPAAIRVLLVDDHRSMLWGLGKLIESAAPELELVAMAASRDEALAAAEKHRPDVILLDLDLGDGARLDHIAELRRCGAKIVVLTGTGGDDVQERAAVAGAHGFVHKAEAGERILKAISRVHSGEPWFDRATMGRMLMRLNGSSRPDPDARALEALTPAERKVIAAVVRLKSAPNKVVAAALDISTHTLRNHLASIYAKLSLKHRLDLVLYAMHRHLDQHTPQAGA
jgi:two-component system nitrate/nitrite response regulator NarL